MNNNKCSKCESDNIVVIKNDGQDVIKEKVSK